MGRLLSAINFQKWKSYADWKLLLFLLLFLNVKIAVKIPAIALIYVLNFDFKFGFKLKGSRLPLFYPLIIGVAVISFLINGHYSNLNYNLVFLTGILFWVFCILAIHQVKLAVERNSAEVVHQTLLLFFIINTVASLVNIGLIILETHALNPYTYQGQFQKYFISTGDFIKGITFDTSTTNAVLNAFGVMYFITKKNTGMTLVCMAVLLLTASNFTNVFTMAVLAVLFVFNSTRNQKSIIVVCAAFLVLFMAKISPQNSNYVGNTLKTAFYKKQVISPWPQFDRTPITQKPDSILTFDEKRIKFATLHLDSLAVLPVNQIHHDSIPKGVIIKGSGRIEKPKPDLNAPQYQWLKTTPPEQTQLVDFAAVHRADLPLTDLPKPSTMPGKVLGFKQTFAFLKAHPVQALTGTGVGNFSSKLAFRATGLKFTGGYPKKYIYINPDFLRNHLDIYLSFFTRSAASHSLTNSPFAVYDQLLSEYGLLGLLALFIFYVGFFVKDFRLLTYGIPLLLFLLFIFLIDYWFEQLSVIVFFELLMFLNIKEGKSLIAQKSI